MGFRDFFLFVFTLGNNKRRGIKMGEEIARHGENIRLECGVTELVHTCGVSAASV